jgi:hypothetical protein
MNKRQQRRSKRYLNPIPPISPFASFEYRSFVTNVFGFFGLFGLIRSGINPGADDPKAWYDRAIRVVGGSLILLLFGGAFLAMILETISQR